MPPATKTITWSVVVKNSTHNHLPDPTYSLPSQHELTTAQNEDVANLLASTICQDIVQSLLATNPEHMVQPMAIYKNGMPWNRLRRGGALEAHREKGIGDGITRWATYLGMAIGAVGEL